MAEAKTFKVGELELPVNARKDLTLVPDEMSFVISKKGEDVELAETIMLGIKNKMPVMLIGPTGCGKTATIKWLASKTRNAYRRAQLNGSTGVDEFVGRWLINSEGTFWVDGILTDAMRHGHWLVLDEINAALPEILFVLHSVLDDDGCLTLMEKGNEIVYPHPDFRVFATMNPSDDYTGTKEMNRALVDRFPLVLNVGYPQKSKELDIICTKAGMAKTYGQNATKSLSPIPTRMVEFAHAMRKLNAEQKIIFACSTRQLINWARLTIDRGVKTAAMLVFAGKMEESERKHLNDELNAKFRDDENLSNDKMVEREEKERLAREAAIEAMKKITTSTAEAEKLAQQGGTTLKDIEANLKGAAMGVSPAFPSEDLEAMETNVMNGTVTLEANPAGISTADIPF